MARFVAFVTAVALVVAIGLQFIPARDPQPGKGRHLNGVMPERIAGWESRPLALGSTEAASGDVEQILKFDDVFLREYARDGRHLTAYVAYWSAGKMPVQVVASHTPDQCWTQSGWSCERATRDVALETMRRTLQPGQGRVFRASDGQVQYLIFWHRVGDRLFDYGPRSSMIPSPWKWLREMAKQPFTAPKEQYFIRLAGDRPLAELKDDPGFDELVEALARLGLASSPHG
ncbi:MAG TPA: exosortase-associated EpsI family protein [Opitutaceae bacterium]|nr:exosortase-associated EpsI family protein [Opitutaceae bacterium]